MKTRSSAKRCKSTLDNNLGGNAESFRPILVLGSMGFFYCKALEGVWQLNRLACEDAEALDGHHMGTKDGNRKYEWCLPPRLRLELAKIRR